MAYDLTFKRKKMPEGPSMVELKEASEKCKGQSILADSGNASVDMSLLVDKKIVDLKGWVNIL